MKKIYEVPQAEEISFVTEDITIVLPDDDLTSLTAAQTTSERI